MSQQQCTGAISPVPVEQLQVFTSQEAWTFCRLSRRSWFRLAAAGRGPKPVNFGGRLIRYRREELERWLKAIERAGDAR